MNLHKTTVCDFVLAGVILIASFSILSSFTGSSINGEKKAVILRNNKIIQVISLDGPAQNITYDNNVIETRQGRIRIVSADCPLKICQHTGWIGSPARVIVCVPQKLLIEITGASEAGYHAVSY